MKRALLAAVFTACASAPPPRPPPRVADRVEVEQVQVGWYQLPSGQYNRPPVEDVRPGHRTPDETHAREIAEKVLAKCQAGAPMEPLQRDFSEARSEAIAVDPQTSVPFRDAALALHPGECSLFRSGYAFHVLKRVR